MKILGRNTESHLSRKIDVDSKEKINDRKDTKKQINKIYKEDKNIFKKLSEL
ncbi:MAG: hypothetical protein ACFE8A_13450 [Candidatus Hodarchaeota archaeon]